MVAFPMTGSGNDDPRKLRQLIERVAELARAHDVPSVVVGLTAPEGDLEFPEFVEFLRGALRVEDQIFRLTRERALLHLADVDRPRAQEVIERLLGQYVDQFPTSRPPAFETRCLDVAPGAASGLSVKTVLTALFDAGPPHPVH